MSDKNKQKRRRARFSIRAILVLTTIVAVFLAVVFGYYYPRAQRQRAAVERLTGLGYEVYYATPRDELQVSNWMVEWLGVDFFSGIEKVYARAEFDDPPQAGGPEPLDLKPLVFCHGLREVELSFAAGRNDEPDTSYFDLSPLSRCDRLESVL